MDSSRLEIYFAPHFGTFTDPILSPEFRAHFDESDTFILEWAEEWNCHEPELESLFNELSRGERQWVKSKMLHGVLKPFDIELQNVLRGRLKKVVLEKPPVEYFQMDTARLPDLILSAKFDEASSLYKGQLTRLAKNMVERDQVFVKMLKECLKTEKNLFVFRGADHERYLRSLLDRESIIAECITYEEAPLLRRLISSLTMGQQIDNVDVQRVIYALLHRQKDDYLEFLSLQRKAESMTEEDLRMSLSPK